MARLVVIAPGRGTYNRNELAYLRRFADHSRYAQRLAVREQADRLRRDHGRLEISALDDAANYQPGKHLPGENASALIFSCAAADFALLDPAHSIEAVLGNSMGWYTTLFTAGTLDFGQAFRLVDTMGAYQQDHVLGGQIIYPMVDEHWCLVPGRETEIMARVARVAERGPDFWAGLSIRLGGFLVLAGTNLAIKALLADLPKLTLAGNEYPFQLQRHGAFHTPIMAQTSNRALQDLADLDWHQPLRPMIDGTGRIWRRHQTPPLSLRDYTLVRQVIEPYDFTLSIRVALREYNPDHLVLLGPGDSLGGAIAHAMIMEGWRGIRSRRDFLDAQTGPHPPLIAMNRLEQAALVI